MFQRVNLFTGTSEKCSTNVYVVCALVFDLWTVEENVQSERKRFLFILNIYFHCSQLEN